MRENQKEHRVADNLEQFRYLTEQEVFKLTGRGLQTLRNDRHLRRGFPYIKIGRSVRYNLNDVIDFMESRKIKTDEL